jgi:hypothetical protein
MDNAPQASAYKILYNISNCKRGGDLMRKKYRMMRIAYLEALLKGALDEKMRLKILKKIEYQQRKLSELNNGV